MRPIKRNKFRKAGSEVFRKKLVKLSDVDQQPIELSKMKDMLYVYIVWYRNCHTHVVTEYLKFGWHYQGCKV